MKDADPYTDRAPPTVAAPVSRSADAREPAIMAPLETARLPVTLVLPAFRAPHATLPPIARPSTTCREPLTVALPEANSPITQKTSGYAHIMLDVDGLGQQTRADKGAGNGNVRRKCDRAARETAAAVERTTHSGIGCTCDAARAHVSST